MAKVGIFDSGVGGLTVVKKFSELYPEIGIIYLGDTARMPYGERTTPEIIKFNEEIISFLIKKGAEVILMGCNTSSSLALERDREIFKIPIFGLIQPVAENIDKITQNKKVGVLATPATVKSRAYSKKIKQYSPDCQVIEVACSKLVPLVEAGQIDGPEVERILVEYLAPILKSGSDTLIYGCTHYPFLGKIIRRICGDRVNLVDPAFYICESARTILENLKKSGPGQTKEFYTTGSVDDFKKLSQNLLGELTGGAEIKAGEISELQKSREDFFKKNVRVNY